MHTGYGSVTHFYLQKTGQIPKKAAAFANIGDYIVMRLCGLRTPKMHPTIAASMGGFDLKNGVFDKEKLQRAGVNTDYYPEVTEKIQAVGKYRGIPLVWALGDNQASFYAAAGESEENLSINVGTGSQVSFFDRTLTEIQAGEIRPFTNQGYLYVQASVNGGKVYERLAEFFLESVRQFTGVELDKTVVYQKMEEMGLAKTETDLQIFPYLYGSRADQDRCGVRQFTGVELDKTVVYQKMEEMGLAKTETDLQIFPYLYGSRADQDRCGEVTGLTEKNFYPSDFIRAFIAGMAKELYDAYQQFPAELRCRKKVIVASGNGIRRNILMQQEIEKVFGLPVILRQIEEEAAVGAAVWAWKEIINGK